MAARQLIQGVPDHVTLGDANQVLWNLPATGARGGWSVRVSCDTDCFVVPTGAVDGAAKPTTGFITIPAGKPETIVIYGTSFGVCGTSSKVIEVYAA